MRRLSALSILLSAVAALLGAGIGLPAASAESCARTTNPIFDAGGYLYDFTNDAVIYGSIREGGSNGPADTPPGPERTADSWNGWGDVYVFAPGADFFNSTPEDRYQGGPERCSFDLGGQRISFGLAQMHEL
jgi:hypothetical protein